MVLRYKLAIQTLLLRSLKFRLFQISVVEIWQQWSRRSISACISSGIISTSSIHRVILNLGGIANVSMLPANNPDGVFGFDTGPANILMDAWCHRHTGHPYDEMAIGRLMVILFALYSTVFMLMSIFLKSHLKYGT